MTLRVRRGSVLAAAALLASALPARADGTGDDADAAVRAALVRTQAHLVDAAAMLALAQPPAAFPHLEGARLELEALTGPRRALRRPIRTAIRRLATARADAQAPGAGDDPSGVVRRLRLTAASVRTAIAHLRRRGVDGCALTERGRVGSIAGSGRVVAYRVLSTTADVATAVLSVEGDDPDRTTLGPEVVARGRGRFRVRFGPDLGAATVTATCGGEATLRAFCAGARGALSAVPPGPPDYGAAPLFARVGTEGAGAAPAVTGTPPFAFSVDPPLPAGLSVDAATGALVGAPTESGPAATYRVTVRNARASAAADVVVDVDPALPAEVLDLAGGFAIDVVADDLAMPVKMAFAPDGRLFLSELGTGALRVIAPDGTLAEDPVATIPTLPGPEQGLFGVAVDPDFATNGYVYAVASAAAESPKPLRNRLLRFTVTGSAAGAPDVLVDDLPLGDTQNGGCLLWGQDGNLYLTTGDVGDEARAQADGDLAGRILRIAPDGSVPADNPDPASYEWCRGFRNVFGLTQDPVSGRIFATENGPAAHDELDFVQPGKNYGWGADPETNFGARTGIRIRDWTPVIVPTGLAAHDGAQFGGDYAGNLFVGCYDPAQVRRVVLDGVDLDDESVFVQFTEEGLDQKPLDVVLAPDGSLRISTFRTIWRVRRD